MSHPADPPHSFTVNPQTPTRGIRHQRSLEHVLNFTLSSPLPLRKEAEEAHFLYHQIISDCEDAGLTVGRDGSKVYLHNLFRAVVKFCPSRNGAINLIRIILHGLFLSSQTTPDDRRLSSILPLARAWLDPGHDHQPTFRILETIAADFLDGFFVPLTAQANCTPHVSGILTAPSASDVAPTQGTPNRLRGLRALCLLRDGNRCVISGNFDKGFHTRARKLGELPRGTFGMQTQAAHIIPHSLNAVATAGDPLSRPQTFVWQILNMFVPGLSTMLEGSLIDSPANAMILVSDIHDEFGKLRCYLEEIPGSANSYTFKTTTGAVELPPVMYPKTEVITFVNYEPEGTRMAELPSQCLLKLHAACCKMMEMAGAGEYVERVLEDMERMEEEGTLAGDGSSDIGMVLRIKGLWGGSAEMVDGSGVTGMVVG